MTVVSKRTVIGPMRRFALVLGSVALMGCEPVPETGIDGIDVRAPDGLVDVSTDEVVEDEHDVDSETLGDSVEPSQDATPVTVEFATAEGEGVPSEQGKESVDGLPEQEVDGVADDSEDAAEDVALLDQDLDPNGISDEQDFDAVSNRQTIESDAARLRAQREAYLEIRLDQLPERGEKNPPSVVEFALSTSNSVGEKVWSRSGILSRRRYQTNCSGYARAELAQEAFLANGGPQRNWQGLDPDGDGFACGWDPAPFRNSMASGG